MIATERLDDKDASSLSLAAGDVHKLPSSILGEGDESSSPMERGDSEAICDGLGYEEAVTNIAMSLLQEKILKLEQLAASQEECLESLENGLAREVASLKRDNAYLGNGSSHSKAGVGTKGSGVSKAGSKVAADKWVGNKQL